MGIAEVAYIAKFGPLLIMIACITIVTYNMTCEN